MPYCNVDNAGTRLFYRTYGHGPIKVLLIIGLAGTHDSWEPQVKGLAGTDIPNDEKSTVDDGDSGNASGVEVCAFDNRGIGRSSVPTRRSEYTTTIMAKDAVALMDHLGWRKAHVFGHSMGGMIACKLAALVPERILSLALLNVTGGGFQCLPKLDRLTISVAIRFLLAKTPEDRAAVDLDTHYSQDYLDECVGQRTRRAILYQEYVKGLSKSGMQSNHGFEGQINACWNHKMTRTEIEKIRSAGFLISVIHGRNDIVAQICHAKRLAEKLHPCAKMVDLCGGHLVSHERTNEVNEALLELIKASESKTSPRDWTNLPDQVSSDWVGAWKVVGITNSTSRSNLFSLYKVGERLNQFLIYLFGVFVLVFEHARRVGGRLKPVRVGASLT
uniref:Carboxylesterase n=1 Tax=Opuntia streptacantha TaxID=393608 RepID=A0A7C8YKZ8_OPUST